MNLLPPTCSNTLENIDNIKLSHKEMKLMKNAFNTLILLYK